MKPAMKHVNMLHFTMPLRRWWKKRRRELFTITVRGTRYIVTPCGWYPYGIEGALQMIEDVNYPYGRWP